MLADIPGLIEGAAEGAGLGPRVPRPRRALRAARPPGRDLGGEAIRRAHYESVRGELARVRGGLERLPELVVLSKRDLLPDEEVDGRRCGVARARSGDDALGVLAVSSATGEGLDELRARDPRGGRRRRSRARRSPQRTPARPSSRPSTASTGRPGTRASTWSARTTGPSGSRGRGVELLVRAPRPREPGGARLPRAAPERDRRDRRACARPASSPATRSGSASRSSSSTLQSRRPPFPWYTWRR